MSRLCKLNKRLTAIETTIMPYGIVVIIAIGSVVVAYVVIDALREIHAAAAARPDLVWMLVLIDALTLLGGYLVVRICMFLVCED